MIDVKNGRLSLQVGDEKVEFHLPYSVASSTLDDTCSRVHMPEEILSTKAMTCHSLENPLEANMIGCDVFESQTRKKGECARLYDASIAYTRRQ